VSLNTGRGFVGALVWFSVFGCSASKHVATPQAALPGRTTTSLTTSTTTTSTSTPPTTLSVNQQIAAYVNIVPKATFAHTADDGQEQIWISFQVNVGPKDIAAFQALVTVTATDALGRTYSMQFDYECTQALTAGHGEAATNEAQDGDANIPADCAVGTWDVNQFIEEQHGLWSALLQYQDGHLTSEGLPDPAGAKATVTADMTRVSFTDGTSIGTAFYRPGGAVRTGFADELV
jgi:hypothetical protein